MPRRHITQREAHANAKRLANLERRLHNLMAPVEWDAGHITAMRALPVDERFRGFLEGAKAGRPITIAARLTPEGIVLHMYGEVANG